MKIQITQVDAFTTSVFGGNPAAVCILEEWLEEKLMQKIGMENNLSETAFMVKEGSNYHIRWFTPTVEVDLCGHATLAAAKVLFERESFSNDEITFQSRSGILKVKKENDGQFTLNFPATPYEPVTDPPSIILDSLKITSSAIYKGLFDYMVIAKDQQEIETLQPDFNLMSTLSSRGLVVTARGNEVDFVSRCFFPQSGINEDPVTGSAHTMLTPYWASVLGKTKFSAIQLSARKGELSCEITGDRVLITGNAVTYLRGEIHL